MYLTTFNKNSEENLNSTELVADVVANVMGELGYSRIALSSEALNETSVKVDVVMNDIKGYSPDMVTLCFAAQFKKGSADKDAMQKYADVRAAPLKKHGGKVLVCGVLGRSPIWDFDGIELIQFPAQENLQALMGDPDYSGSPEVKEASAVFGGNFSLSAVKVV
ncbi:MAG: hypothetical protein ABW185_21655 [Sedimenticola sp.]